MNRIATFVLLLAITALVGCQTLPSDGPPNVFRPIAPSNVGCEEMEYRGESESGFKRRFYPGTGGFCSLVTRLPDTPVLARCVERDTSGRTTWEGEWVESVPAQDLEYFLYLCPKALDES